MEVINYNTPIIITYMIINNLCSYSVAQSYFNNEHNNNIEANFSDFSARKNVIEVFGLFNRQITRRFEILKFTVKFCQAKKAKDVGIIIIFNNMIVNILCCYSIAQNYLCKELNNNDNNNSINNINNYY